MLHTNLKTVEPKTAKINNLGPKLDLNKLKNYEHIDPVRK